MSSGLILKMNKCYKGLAESSRSSYGEGRNGSCTPYFKGRGDFYRPLGGLLVKFGYFTNKVKLRGQWGP
jgi:hypothetical protein